MVTDFRSMTPCILVDMYRHSEERAAAIFSFSPSAWGHLNPSSYCDVGRLFYGVFKL